MLLGAAGASANAGAAIKPKNRIETMAVTFAALMLNLLIKTVQMLPS